MERRVFVAVDDAGQIKLGGQWALAEIKGPARRDQVTVTSAVDLIAEANLGRKSLMFFNMSSDTTFYVGEDDGVTQADGWPVPPGAVFIDNISNSAWYGVAGSAVDVRTIEVSTE